MRTVTGNYFLSLKVGERDLPITAQCIKEFSIIQDTESLLPAIELKLEDPNGELTHLLPFDSKANKLSVQFSIFGVEAQDFNAIDFSVFRRKPLGDFQQSNTYEVSGLMTTENTFAPSFSRASAVGETIKDFLIRVASELGCDQYDISSSLDYVKTILQPNWTNIELLTYLRTHLQGVNGEGFYKIFIACNRGKKIFYCLPWNELVLRQNYYKFVNTLDPIQDFYPIVGYRLFDNYLALNAFGARNQGYNYFDYYTSSFTQGTVTPEDIVSLTDYHMIDENDSEYSDSIWLGRNNEYTSDYAGRVRGIYHDRLSNLSKIWIDSWGLQNLQPGSVVMLMFPTTDPTSSMADYQYSGLWVVEKVIHLIKDSFTSRLLLTRNGLDTSRSTTLMRAQYRVTNIPTYIFPSVDRVPSFDGVISTVQEIIRG